MEVLQTQIPGVIELIPKVFEDDRGHFFESFNQTRFNEIVPNTHFVQDNESFSSKGTLRGLHFQNPPYSQAKLVRVITGKVLDIAVDIRQGSPTYGQHASIVLDSKKHNIAFVPKGFAHGFYAIEDAIFQYKCTNFYNKESEGGLFWNDETLKINWQTNNSPIISEKDQILPLLKDMKSNFSI